MHRCIPDQAGRIVGERNMASAPEPFLTFIAPYRADLVVGVECIFTWYPGRIPPTAPLETAPYHHRPGRYPPATSPREVMWYSAPAYSIRRGLPSLFSR